MPRTEPPDLTRRAALAGVPALAATLAGVGTTLPASADAATSPLPAEIRALATELHAAIWREVDAEAFAGLGAERDPAWQAASATTEALNDRFEELADRIHDTPVRSWADVQARAEVARRFINPDRAGRIEFPDSEGDNEMRALYDVLRGVLAMGGQHV